MTTTLRDYPTITRTGRTVHVGQRVYLQRAPGCAKRWYTYAGLEGDVCVLQPYGRDAVGGTRWVRPERIDGIEPRRRT